MGKGERIWPTDTRSNQIRSEPSNSFQFNDPPSNMYPDLSHSPRNYRPVGDDYVSSGNRPWQMNRGDFGTNQNPRTKSPSWNGGSGFDSRLKDSQGWNYARQSASYNQQIDSVNSTGWRKQDTAARMDLRLDGTNESWNDRQTAGERSGWNLSKGINEYPIRSQVLPESSPVDRFRGLPPTNWSNQHDVSKEPSKWFDMPSNPDWREQSQEERWYGASSGYINDGGSREEANWRKRSDRPNSNEWNLQKKEPDTIKKSHLESDSNILDWQNTPRHYDDLGWMNKPSHEPNPVWSNPPRAWVESNSRDIYNESNYIPLPDKQSFTRNPGPVGGPFLERKYGRKRGRSPEDKNVWSRLEPQDLINESHNKKLRVSEHQDTGIGEEVRTMIEQVRMQMNFPKKVTPLAELQPRPPNNDLRLKLSKQDLPLVKGQHSFKVCIVPQFKKSRFKIRDKEQLGDKLINALYKMAQSDDLENLPQLRFSSFVMESTTCMAINCHDAASTKWLLGWDHGAIRLPVRKVLPEDPHQLAVIGFDVKGVCNVNLENMKFLLKIQNPGLDTSCWKDGEIKHSKKRRMFIYMVDGHTLRFLVNHEWELFFGMQRLFVRRIKTNFDYNPQAFAYL